MTDLTVHPVTPDRWPDLEALFGPRGAMAGCWCMWWRVSRREWEENKGDGNREALKAIAEAGEVPGLLAYDGARPVGWVSVAPRGAFPVLQRSRVLKPVDDLPVWSVVCFFIHKDYRQQGMSARLLDAAVEYARSQGAGAIEGYPLDPRSDDAPGMYAFTGLVSTFEAAGFREIARRSESKPIMRLVLRES